MARRLAPLLSIAALFAACSHNPPPSDSTMNPASAPARSADAGRDGPGGDGRRVGPGDPGGRGGPGARGEQMALRAITLSADQQQRIDAIRARYRTEMEQMRQQAPGDREAMRTHMREMMEKQQGEIRAVLTADQQRQFDRNVAEMRARMEQGGDRPGRPPVERDMR